MGRPGGHPCQGHGISQGVEVGWMAVQGQGTGGTVSCPGPWEDP